MALIKRADSADSPRRAVALDLGDLARRADVMREAALAEARRIIAEARAERERIVAGAREAGHAEGLELGRAEGLEAGREQGRREAFDEHRERLERLESAWEHTLAEIAAERDALLSDCRRSAVELAAAIAERVVHRAVALDPTLVQDQMRELLALVVAPSTLIVRIHPDDEDLVEHALPGIRQRLADGVHVRLVTDPSLSRGSCVARTLGGAEIDGGIETQLQRVVEDLLPEPPAARLEEAA